MLSPYNVKLKYYVRIKWLGRPQTPLSTACRRAPVWKESGGQSCAAGRQKPAPKTNKQGDHWLHKLSFWKVTDSPLNLAFRRPHLTKMHSPPGVSMRIQLWWPAHQAKNSRDHYQHHTGAAGFGRQRCLQSSEYKSHYTFTVKVHRFFFKIIKCKSVWFDAKCTFLENLTELHAAKVIRTTRPKFSVPFNATSQKNIMQNGYRYGLWHMRHCFYDRCEIRIRPQMYLLYSITFINSHNVASLLIWKIEWPRSHTTH